MRLRSASSFLTVREFVELNFFFSQPRPTPQEDLPYSSSSNSLVWFFSQDFCIISFFFSLLALTTSILLPPPASLLPSSWDRQRRHITKSYHPPLFASHHQHLSIRQLLISFLKEEGEKIAGNQFSSLPVVKWEEESEFNRWRLKMTDGLRKQENYPLSCLLLTIWDLTKESNCHLEAFFYSSSLLILHHHPVW